MATYPTLAILDAAYDNTIKSFGLEYRAEDDQYVLCPPLEKAFDTLHHLAYTIEYKALTLDAQLAYRLLDLEPAVLSGEEPRQAAEQDLDQAYEVDQDVLQPELHDDMTSEDAFDVLFEAQSCWNNILHGPSYDEDYEPENNNPWSDQPLSVEGFDALFPEEPGH